MLARRAQDRRPDLLVGTAGGHELLVTPGRRPAGPRPPVQEDAPELLVGVEHLLRPVVQAQVGGRQPEVLTEIVHNEYKLPKALSASL